MYMNNWYRIYRIRTQFCRIKMMQNPIKTKFLCNFISSFNQKGEYILISAHFFVHTKFLDPGFNRKYREIWYVSENAVAFSI